MSELASHSIPLINRRHHELWAMNRATLRAEMEEAAKNMKKTAETPGDPVEVVGLLVGAAVSANSANDSE